MKIINVSYRLPVSFQRDANTIRSKISSGGLVSSILSLKTDKRSLHWVGVADFTRNDYLEGKQQLGIEFEMHPIFLDKNINHGFYNGFSNSVLWPLFHYFPSFVEFKEKDRRSYLQANRIIAEHVLQIAEPDDKIWIHDYQLLPLAGMIREKLPTAKIGFFLHIPFPAYELIRILPKHSRDILLKSMLGADLIGFHTYEYAQHFLDAIQMIGGLQHNQFNLQYQNRTIKAGVFPIGVNFDKFNEAYNMDAIVKERNELRSIYENKKIIFSVDRLDYSKGIVYRLKGFARFLNDNPEWREKIVFILVAVPSRIVINKYIERRQMIEMLISKINGKYGSVHWNPVVYQYGSLNFNDLVGLYTCCDMALISPLRDGMNLVAKEFIASRNDIDGVLLLSDMTGAAKQLSRALLFNPLDEEEIAKKIKTALEMPAEERYERMLSMRDQVRKNSISKWRNDFLQELEAVCNLNSPPVNMEDQHTGALFFKFKNSNKRLILLDYDGTLSEYQTDPNQAVPSQNVLKLMHDLSHNKNNTVALISGRSKDFLDEWFGHLPITFIAEHGAFVKTNGWRSILFEKTIWKENVKRIMQTFSENCPGTFVEEKELTVCWHYRNAELESGFAQSRELISLLKNYLLETATSVVDGNKIVEVKPSVLDKGSAVTNIFDLQQFDFCMAVGDDKTDEDMFRVVNAINGITIKVGDSNSIAKYRIPTVEEVLSLLNGAASSH